MKLEDILTDEEREAIKKAQKKSRRAGTKYGSLLERDDDE